MQTLIAPGDTIAVIGLGNMGAPLVRRWCAAGFHVNGYDPEPTATDALRNSPHFHASASSAAAVEHAKVVILILPNSAIVDHVLLHEGVLDRLGPGSVLIDMGSSQPASTRQLAEEGARRDVILLDAPVSGGVPSAVDGTLTVMVGGSRDTADRCVALFQCIGKQIVFTGASGSAHALKAINNLLSGSHLVASSEALTIGTRFGLDPQLMAEVINSSSGQSWSTLTKWPRYILPRTFDSGFSLDLLVKDTRIAVELSESTGVSAPHALATLALLEEAASALRSGADHTEIARWVETRTSDVPRDAS